MCITSYALLLIRMRIEIQSRQKKKIIGSFWRKDRK